MSSLVHELQGRLTIDLPLLATGRDEGVVLELKPYLQPFEVKLAQLEASSLLGCECELDERLGLCFVHPNADEARLRELLTYWQRVGRTQLEPTRQVLMEASQNGGAALRARTELHGARRLRYGPHDLHEYRGKFFPQLVRSLINISRVEPSSLVFDPMCGSGTTLCEAVAAGMKALGSDLNPLSVLIAETKTLLLAEDPRRFRKLVDEYARSFELVTTKPEDMWPDEDLTYLRRWFSPEALSELAAVLSVIRRVRRPLYRSYLSVCLSNILRSVSWQKLADLRVRKEVRPYKKGEALVRFLEEVERQADRIHSYLEVRVGARTGNVAEVLNTDAVHINGPLIKYIGKVDLLITSPPYATALPYLDTDRLSLILLGLLPRCSHRDAESRMVGTREVSEAQRRELWSDYERRRHELPDCITELVARVGAANHGEGVGFRRRNLPALLGKYFTSMLDAMRAARSLMRPTGTAYYVVGNNSTEVDGRRIEIPTDRFLFELGERAGWRKRDFMPMELLVSRDIFKDNRGSSESILGFEAS